MNFIAFDAAYSLYPQATFEHVINLALKNDKYRDQRCVAKYAKRGWRTIANCWPQDDEIARLFCLNNERFVGDDSSWTMRLDTKKTPKRPRLSPRSEPFAWDPASMNSWRLAPTTSIPWKVAPTFTLVKTPVFKFTYMCASDSICHALRTFGNQQGLLQWTSVPNREARLTMPIDWSWYVSRCPSSITMFIPVRWDSLVPDILHAFRPFKFKSQAAY